MPPNYDSKTKAVRQLQELIPPKGLLHQSLVGWYIEGRVFQRLQHNVFIIRSVEGAPTDGFLIITGPQVDAGSSTDRLMQVLGWDEEGELFEIMTFDVKGVQILCFSRGGVMRFKTPVLIKPKQNANCSFYLVVLRENSQYIAFLSPDLFIKPNYRGKEKRYLITYDVPRWLIQFIDYIPDAVPWTVHIDELSRVLQDLRDQRRQGLPLTINGIPLMTTGKTFASASLVASRRSAEFQIIRFFHDTFKSRPDLGLSLHLLDFQPLFADFWIKKQGSSPVLIELKGTTEQAQYVRRDGWLEHVSFQYGRTMSIFHPGRPWDHLLSYNQALKEFYFIPFDYVPREWRSTTVRAKSEDLPKQYVGTSADGLEQFRIHLGGARWLEKLVQILQIRRSSPNHYDVSTLYTGREDQVGEIADLQMSVEDDTIEAEALAGLPEDPSSDEADEAISLSAAFQGEVMERLMHDCALSMKGLYFYLGRLHPIAEFVFVQYSWTVQEQRAYLSCRKMPMHIAELTDMTRVVLLSAFHAKDALVSTGGLTTNTSNPHRFFRQLPAIMLLATGNDSRKPASDEPVNFLPLSKLLTSKEWSVTKLDEVRKFHARHTYYKGKHFKLGLERGTPVTHSIHLSEVHQKMLQIIRGRDDFQVGIDPAQVYASKPYLHPWKQVKMLHATNIYANNNAD